MFLFSGYNFQLYIYIPRPTLSSQLVLSAHSGLHGGNIPRSSHGKTGEELEVASLDHGLYVRH